MALHSGKIRVAINGGGLAGASLFHALLQHPNLDVHIFERASAFKEAGAGISITRNALNALDLLSPSAIDCLKKAGAVPHFEALLKLAQGPEAGESVSEITDKERLVHIVSRAAFLRELLASAPAERMHASKTLQDVLGTGPLTLKFTDGSEHACDILVGADGIHSRVRTILLGPDDPAAEPVPAGWWAVQALKPYAEMRTQLGKDLIDVDNPRELGWLGDRTFLYTTLLSEGNLVQFVLIGCHDDKRREANNWQDKIDTAEIRELFGGWPAQLWKAVEELVCQEETQNALFIWEHLHARTYASGGLCVMGDAAHSSTPWQGSGGGMSIEDALVLSTLLSQAETPHEARAGLGIYDRLRRERTQKIVDSSRGTGLILTNLDAEVGQDAEKVRGKLKNRWDFILGFDVKGLRDEAVELINEWRRGNSGGD